ncbi:MAG: glycosyltransferase family 2 protein [Elusimicrobia bacterium]|nr:glycosyltransferase family 2 protein [Elusimicrobiota bacterium]
MPPRVSVVIPAWNAAAFIEKTLATVAAQTYKDFEVVVVDDGSKDDTKALVDAYLAKTALRGRCLKQENKKIAGARNAGIRAAEGEFVAFLDHDDLWFPTKLAETMAEFDAHPEADLVCHDENIVKDGKLVRVSHNGPLVERMYEKLLFDGNALSPSATTVRKAKLFEAGLFREDEAFNTVEDYDLWMRLARVCRMRFLPKVLGEYQLVERGASNKIVYHNTNLEHLLRDHFKNFPDPDSATRARMRRRLGVMCRSAARLLIGQGDLGTAGRYARRAVAECPTDWKNAATLTLWALKRLGT